MLGHAGVALMSTMARAVAGADYGRDGATPPPPEAFAAQSPAQLLAAAVGAPPARWTQPQMRLTSTCMQAHSVVSLLVPLCRRRHDWQFCMCRTQFPPIKHELIKADGVSTT